MSATNPTRWTTRAACFGSGARFFPPWTEQELAAALDCCDRCPVAAECLGEVVDAPQVARLHAGIRGGLVWSRHHRRWVEPRPPGRPRKDQP